MIRAAFLRFLAVYALGVMAACVAGLGVATACSSPQLPTTPQVLDARQKTELAVALSAQALPLVTAEVERLIGTGAIAPPEADKVRAGLSRADSVLALAEAWLAGRADAPGREEVLEAIDGVTLAASIARASGGKLPGITDRALELAREVVEGKAAD